MGKPGWANACLSFPLYNSKSMLKLCSHNQVRECVLKELRISHGPPWSRAKLEWMFRKWTNFGTSTKSGTDAGKRTRCRKLVQIQAMDEKARILPIFWKVFQNMPENENELIQKMVEIKIEPAPKTWGNKWLVSVPKYKCPTSKKKACKSLNGNLTRV